MKMKNLFVLIKLFVICCWAIPKPMESVENYNVMIVHGAYGSDHGFSADSLLIEAYRDSFSLENGATLGRYNNTNRITNWVSRRIFEEPGWEKDIDYVHNSYVYNWRSFSNPANTSLNNAYELGDRKWNAAEYGISKFGKRRALLEESQEVKASYIMGLDTLHGQTALEMMRKNPDLYRQLASRYILIGHSMGGVVSREYVQSDYYNDDVDKIVTLDSPHEGTGALNMQLNMQWSNYLDNNALEGLTTSGFAISSRHPEQSEGSSEVKV